MGVRPSLIILLFLMVFVPFSGSALIPDRIVLSSDTEWLIAGSSTPATLTAELFNQSTPLPAVQLIFSLSDPGMGTLQSPSSSTDGEGRGTVLFTSKTVSGDVIVTASARYVEGDEMRSIDASILQKIDHGEPHALMPLSYPGEATVGTSVTISLSIRDVYGNLVDNRREVSLSLYPEYVTMTVTSAGDEAGFLTNDGILTTATIPVDSSGLITQTLQLDTLPGDHVVLIDPSPVLIPERWITISSIENGEPHTVTQELLPTGSPNYAPADGLSQFSINYVFHDIFGNRAGGRKILFSVTTTAGTEDHLLNTSSRGEILITYGPSVTIGHVSITCTSIDNPEVTQTTLLEFINTEPVAMLLTANPQMIASRDVDPDISADIRAKVIDEKGNPVSGENVTFSIHSVDTGDYLVTGAPELDSTSARTNADGFAIVRFRPGSFTRDQSHENFSATATGTATISAVWNGDEKTIPITWKNYPYLSINTVIEPETVAVNETITVTITIIGDGWALRPDPVDVVLCIDRSGSMLFDNPDRMVWTIEAADTFNNAMAEGYDRVGLVSYGTKDLARIHPDSYYYSCWAGRDNDCSDWEEYTSLHYPGNPRTYSAYATLDMPLTDDKTNVQTAVSMLVPNGGTPMRAGLYRAIRELVENGRPDSIRTVILLGDGDYNWYGDPLARGTRTEGWFVSPTSGYYFPDLTTRYYPFNDLSSAHQNLAVYAEAHGIKIYTIAFSEDVTAGGQETLRTLAESTGGTYYYAPDGGDLAGIYADIAGELSTEAGVNTELEISHRTVMVNNEPVQGGGYDGVFTYLPPTRIMSYIGEEIIIPEYTIDQTDDWRGITPPAENAPAYSLSFDAGTIQLGQVWQARYHLYVRKEGTIDVFDPESSVTFENAPDALTLPITYLTAIPPISVIGLSGISLDITNLKTTATGSITEYLPITWDLVYDGSGMATQQIRYTVVDPMVLSTLGPHGPYIWQIADIRYSPGGTTHHSISLDITGRDGICLVHIHASAPGSADVYEYLEEKVGFASGRAFIKIE
ncbi:VWA domain-containing protein [Methanocalculus sp.]|uniref:VWA domain-containing protein n=1 Tax=Methanocalculus sp. TaxID=2004547 RepID=UPI00271A283A|nr:VWA domain-containing protein [Methanocalculus sp.]MDO8842324.1 VWA domain-containing protein [Methanocalculus sp.]